MKALILAAGFGTRMKPLTDEIPKPLIPILNIPVIEYNIYFLKKYGVREFFINLHHKGGHISDYLGDGSRFGVKISYLRESEILGTGGAIANLKNFVDSTFIVINSDTIFNFNLEEMMDLHFSRKNLVTLGVVPADSADRRAVVTVNEEKIICRMLSKSFSHPIPAGNTIFTGLHIIEPKLLEYIPAGVFVSITDYVYSRMVDAHEKINGFLINGDWWDIGTPDAFFDCNFELLQKLPDYIELFTKTEMPGNLVSKENGIVLGAFTQIPAVPVNSPVVLGSGVKFPNATAIGPKLIAAENVFSEEKKVFENSIYVTGTDANRHIRTTKGLIYY